LLTNSFLISVVKRWDISSNNVGIDVKRINGRKHKKF
jgi:hypothetical protein